MEDLATDGDLGECIACETPTSNERQYASDPSLRTALCHACALLLDAADVEALAARVVDPMGHPDRQSYAAGLIVSLTLGVATADEDAGGQSTEPI